MKRKQATRTPSGVEVGKTEQRGGFMNVPTNARHLVRACASPERRRDRAKLAAGRQSRATSRPIRYVVSCVYEEACGSDTRRETGSRSTKSDESSRFRTSIIIRIVSEGVVKRTWTLIDKNRAYRML